MPVALAKDTDLSSESSGSASTLRDFFLTLINANDKRYVDLFIEKDNRYEQRFASQQEAIRTTFLAQEKLVTQVFDLHKENLNRLFLERDARYHSNFEEIKHEVAIVRTAASDMCSAKEHAVYVAINSLKEGINQSLTNAERAVSKADAATEKRFDAVNEFRSTLGDQQRTLIPRLEVEVIVKGLEGKIATLITGMSEQNTRIVAIAADRVGQDRGLASGWGYAVGAIGLVVAVLTIAWRFH